MRGILGAVNPTPRSGVVRSHSGGLAICLLMASSLLTNSAAKADKLQDYAQQCDSAIGATVPDFDCDTGTEVPMTHPVFDAQGNLKACDRPNRLNRECDPGSRF